jgi:hydroxymethylglutaryl-CoA lyase
MNTVILEDETLRDGLQTVPAITLEEKKHLFDMLVEAGVRRIQVGSFVHPKIVPQMSDTDELVAMVKGTPGVTITGLILNDRGLDRALSAGLKHLSMSVSISDAHSRKNANRPATEALAFMADLVRKAVAEGVTVRAGAQCAFGCVYQGTVPEEDVMKAVCALSEAGASEINLADTTGMANPVQVRRLVGLVREAVPDRTLSFHLHDTRGLGLANMFAGYEAGVTIFDVAAGGLGGCPFVKGAAGNVPTEDAVNLFDQTGVATAIDMATLLKVVEELEHLFKRELPGRALRVWQAGRSCDA